MLTGPLPSMTSWWAVRCIHSHGGWAGGEGGGMVHGSRTSEKSHLLASMSP